MTSHQLHDVFAPHLDRHVKLGGRRPPRVGTPVFKLRNYLRLGQLPTVPSSYDPTGPAMSCLSDVDLNDQLGDCVIAAKAHVDGVWTANAGKLVAATHAQVLAQYEAIGGYNPNDPSTDQGCNMQDALNYWTKTPGPTGHTLEAWLAIDATNAAEIKAACYLFGGGILTGIGLPDAWINPFPSQNGFVWDSAGSAIPSNGHCVPQIGYDSTSMLIDSWGLIGHLTFKAIAKYCVANTGGELYITISPDQLIGASQLAPNGLNVAQLITDWDSVFGGFLPAPIVQPPAPVPSPTPGPSGAVSLDQAEAWATSGLSSHAIWSRNMAVAAIKSGLSKNWPKS